MSNQETEGRGMSEHTPGGGGGGGGHEHTH